jgi:hypothetical protein
VATGSGSWHCRGCGKGVSFVAIATQLYLCSGSRSRQRNRKPGVEFHDRNHSASFVALSARVLIDGVLLAPAPRSASLPHCGSATRDYVGATDERASRQDCGCAWTPPAGAPANPREGERNPQALFVSPLVDYEVRPATL